MEATRTLGGDFISLRDVAREMGWGRRTLASRLRRHGIAAWVDPADERYRLIKREDFEQLKVPRPVQSASNAHAA